MRRAGVRPVRFHDLRHTFGTQMAAAGAPLRAIQEWMGHSDYRTTSIYADYAPDPSQGALYAAKAFGALGTVRPPDVLEELALLSRKFATSDGERTIARWLSRGATDSSTSSPAAAA